MIAVTMSGWRVDPRQVPTVGFSGENDVETLLIATADSVAEYDILTLEIGDNIIDLTTDDDGMQATLTARAMGDPGIKRAQVVCKNSDTLKIKKSNIFYILVEESILCAERYINPPEEFIKFERYIRDSVDTTAAAAEAAAASETAAAASETAAAESASRAAESATQAEAAKAAAVQSAAQAETAATAAAASETAAAQSASQAAESATQAEAAKTAAAGSEAAAAQSAAQAAASETATAQSASQAAALIADEHVQDVIDNYLDEHDAVPTIDTERIDDGAEITVHDIHGEQTVKIYDGEKGDTGRGIESVVVDYSNYHLRVTYDDGEYADAGYIRGPQGESGDKGEKGEDGAAGNGIENIVYEGDIMTVTTTDGQTYQSPSLRGPQGPAYELTEQDTAIIVQEILQEALPQAEEYEF